MSAGPRQIALSEVIGGLSYALDLTEGEPPGPRGALVPDRDARRRRSSGSTPRPARDLFYALLLKDAGCSANSARMAALFGADDHVAKRTSKRVDWSRPLPAFVWSLRTVAPGGSLRRARFERLLAIKAEGEVTRALMQARCDRGAEIALLLGLRGRDRRGDPRARRALGRPRPAARPARRGDPAAGADPVPRPDGRDLPRRRRRSRRRWAVAAGAAAAGSTRASSTRSGRLPRHGRSGGRSPRWTSRRGSPPTGC